MATAAPNYPESLFSSTVKDKRGDLHTARGQSYEEWYTNLSQVVGGDDNVDKILEEISQRVSAEAPAATAAPSGGGGWDSNPPNCQHGTMRAQSYEAKSGPKKGQQQHTFFCPQPREAPDSEKCSPVDGITRKPWGSK